MYVKLKTICSNCKIFPSSAPNTVYIKELRGSVPDVGKSSDDTHQKRGKTCMYVAMADKQEDGMDEDAKLAVATEQPPDIAVPACNHTEEACALSTTCLW